VTRLDPFYPVVPDESWVARLVPTGTRLVQLRLKDRLADEVRRQVRSAKALCAVHGAQLVVNDHWQIAIDEKCAWVHLGQEDLATADVPAIRRAGLKLGVSTHDRAELEKGLAADPDYLALGPIWPTQLKKMPWAPQGLERIGEWKKLIGVRPLVAIGGLTLERALQCLKAGADCAAVVGDIVNNPDPLTQARRWMEALRAQA
jgi:thiamine-phosphate pyrophosphorylase